MARSMEKYLRPEVKTTPFCPGCGHGVLMGSLLRAIDQLELDMTNTLFVSGIGCAAWIPSPNFAADTLHTLHGRAVAFATGAKAANPDLKVIVISGDGDLASIGGNHLIHAARRNLELTVICANNMIYGMTGGQMAPTTPEGHLTATSVTGNPYRPFDLVKLVKGAGAPYVARGAVTRPYELIGYLKKAIASPEFAFVDVLSPCPTQYGRRNKFDSPGAMYERLRNLCQTGTEGTCAPEDAGDTLLLGEFND
ncbi:MAG: 2-oxoacid:ferredoxin oxidoreductase subunit beta [Deltaproteobacteria bacterium]|nr:2-oxoacid:ferredoxin oxidoreductase subunit beta [Deltaproteobacteria bacterium]